MLAPFLNIALLQRALDALLQITNRDDEEGRCWTLMALLPHVDEPQKDMLIRWVFDKHFAQPDPMFRSRMFRKLASYLPPDLLMRAFEETFQMSRSDRVMTLCDLLPRLAEAESERAFASVQQGGNWDDFLIPSDLARIAPYLLGPTRNEAIRLATSQIQAQHPSPSANSVLLSEGEQQAARDHEMGFASNLKVISGQLKGSELLQVFETLLSAKSAHQTVETVTWKNGVVCERWADESRRYLWVDER